MRIASQALIVLLFLTTAAAAATTNPNRLGNDVVPLSQAVDLKLDADKADYSGSTRIALDVRKPVQSFRLHADAMNLTKVALTGKSGEVAISHAPGDDATLVITATKPLAAGRYTLDIDFANEFGTRAVGLYKMTTRDGQGYAFTQFQAADAREAFPCFDEPGIKIPYTLTISVPEAHHAVANTPAVKESVEAGWKRTEFAATRPLPSYLVAFATGPFEFVPIKDLRVPGRIVTVKGQSHLAALSTEIVAPLLEAMETYFTIPYPYEKIDVIAVPEYWAGAMENPGAITFRDSILLLDRKTATPAQIRNVTKIMAHELAHMWFGDYVTMAWWDDLWLNESFADWFGDKITHQVHPQMKLDLVEAQSIENIMNTDARPSTDPIRRTVDVADNALKGVGLAYNKGKSVLSMFESWLGEETFRKGVIAHMKAHAHGNATSADFFGALSKAAGRDIGPAMASFINQSGLPLVKVELQNGGKVRLSQTRFLNAGTTAPAQQWLVPVALKYGRGGKTATKVVLLDAQSKTVDLGEGVEWVFPNASMKGYYRWQLDPAVVADLSKRAATVLTPAERISFTGNVSALLDAGALRGDEYLQAIAPFAGDEEPLVVSSVLTSMNRIDTVFVTDELKPAFNRYRRDTFAPALERFGVERREGEDSVVTGFRPQLVGVLAATDLMPELNTKLAAMGRKYLDDPQSVDPTLASAGLVALARKGDAALFDTYRQRFENAKTPVERNRFLSALGAFETPELRDAAMKYSLAGSLRPTELFTIAFATGDAERFYSYVTENFDTLASRLPPQYVPSMVYIGAGCDADRLSKAKAFFADPKRRTADVEREMAKIENQVNDCVALRAREGASVAKYLEQYAK